MRVAVITVSDSVAKGERQDASGPMIAGWAKARKHDLVSESVCADDTVEIVRALLTACDTADAELVLTTGGTGLAARGVTPEATRAVIEREAPGIAEAIRLASRDHTPHWMLSRGVAGARGSTLIVNFPGSPKAIDETGAVLAASLPHALALLAGRPSSHRPG